MNNILYGLFGLWLALLLSTSCIAQKIKPPGSIITHLPAVERAYLGSPSMCVLPNGSYLVSCDIFGKDTEENRTLIFRSRDRGVSWRKIAETEQFWSTIFQIRDTVYLLGTIQANSDIVIRQSTDGGRTWTKVRDDGKGTILKGKYHTAPTNIVIRNNRIYKAFEDANRDEKWPSLYGSFIIHADIHSDLLKAESWTQSNVLFRDSLSFDKEIQGWLEGNVIVDKRDSLRVLLRVHTLRKDKEFVANISIENGALDSTNVTLYEFPGGSKKFDIKYDTITRKYWSLVNYVPEDYRNIRQLDRIRNTVCLVSSEDLVKWKLEKSILSHPDIEKHGFQYLSFQIEGDDIIAVCRTAFDDLYKGVSDYHNSNFITFHRISNFRN